ncbi:hypothetical protein NDU88_003528 [Pleurodeles waltl]|uniref:Uncharacterized protein n=1 Tax=Pleurodeles waltl TaxID=8319 RepID=A0AAV7KYD0_PLEWA|nr:hypothetical protein NDU88_003528 [Pleurodeles waltl]
MLCEWAENKNEASKCIWGILIKYGNIDRSKILAEIAAIESKLNKDVDQEMIRKFNPELKPKLSKLEETVKTRKALKFQCDRVDYERGQIFTFAKKFNHLRKQRLSERNRLGEEIVLGKGSVPALKWKLMWKKGQ